MMLRAAWILLLAGFVAGAKKTAKAKDLCREVDTNSEQYHVEEILSSPDLLAYSDDDPDIQESLKQLQRIYLNKIKPIERQFHYPDLRRHVMSDADIYAKPIILVVGPWSTGKSTMLNYLLGIEDSPYSLHTGAEPTTTDFYVISYGDEYRKVDGVVLATDSSKAFGWTEKFGQSFVEHLYGIEMPAPLLRNVTIVDTPGLFENRIQPKRGYPHDRVMQWLVRRADMVIVVFDPTKLEVGDELVHLFKQLKGRESTYKIVLNKADTVDGENLMRVYGAFTWALSPLINISDPPRIYLGSYWSRSLKYRNDVRVLIDQERQLLNDIRDVIKNRIYLKIALVRQYAIRVKLHALLVDSYVSAYHRNVGILSDGQAVTERIIQEPEKFGIAKSVLANENVSVYDLPDAQEYADFFAIHQLSEHKRISDFCSMFYGCPSVDRLNEAISQDLPKLLAKYQHLKIQPGRADDACMVDRRHLPTSILPKYRQRMARRGKRQRFSTRTARTIGSAESSAEEMPEESAAAEEKEEFTAQATTAEEGMRPQDGEPVQATDGEGPATAEYQQQRADRTGTTAGSEINEERPVHKEEPAETETTTKTKKTAGPAPGTPEETEVKKVTAPTGYKVVEHQPAATKRLETGTHAKQERKQKQQEEMVTVAAKRNQTVAYIASGTVTSRKCNKYRKSCRLRPLQQEKAAEPIMIRYGVNGPQLRQQKCKLYRKSCKGVNLTETALKVSGGGRMFSDVGGMILDVVPASSSFLWKLTSFFLPGMSLTTSVVLEKACPRYRKSCKDRKSKVKVVMVPGSQQMAVGTGASLPSGMLKAPGEKCIIYRKSCRRQQQKVVPSVVIDEQPTQQQQQVIRNSTPSQKTVKETRNSAVGQKNQTKPSRANNQSTANAGVKKSEKTSSSSLSSSKKNETAATPALKGKTKKPCKRKVKKNQAASTRVSLAALPKTLKLPCNRFRKSCQETAKQLLLARRNQTERVTVSTTPTETVINETALPLTVISASGQRVRAAATRPHMAKCPKYRKTCKTASLVYMPAQDGVATAIPQSAVIKCPLYRKSCNASTVMKPTAVPVTAIRGEGAATTTTVIMPEMQQIGSTAKKCNRYRLSCQKMTKSGGSDAPDAKLA